MDFYNKIILILIFIFVIILGILIWSITLITYTSNYECVTTDNEIINCKKVWHNQGYMTGITENNETYTIKFYKEIK